MAGVDPSSVSVSFTGDDAELDATLNQLAEKAQTTAEDVEEAFANTTIEVDDRIANQQLDDLATKADDLGKKRPQIKPGVDGADDEDTKSKLDDLATKADDLGKKRPEIKPGVNDGDDEDTKTKLDDLTTKADELGKKRPDIKPEVNDGDYEDTKFKLDDLDTKADDLGKKRPDIKPEVNDGDFEDVKVKLSDLDTKAAELDAEPVEIRTDVDDEDYADTVAKLEALKALADDIGAKNVVYNVRLSGSSVAEGASESDVKAAAQDLAGDLGNIVLKSMATVALGAVLMPAAEVVASGLIYAIGGALTTAFSGANFALALTGSKNPVTIKFKKEVETILTSFDKAMAPYTAPALHSLLAPLSAYLLDVAPDVKGFGEGLEAIAQTLTTSLQSPAVKKVFSGIGTATAAEMKQFGPVLANSLEGLGQLLVAAEPLILSFGKIATAMTKEFASPKAGKDESAWFQKLAKDLNQYAPIIHSIFDQIGTDLSTFASDIKPLEGPALKSVNDGLKVLGDVLTLMGPIISLTASSLASIEKLPGGNTAAGIATLGLAFKSTRGLFGDLAKLAVHAGALDGLTSLIKTLGASNLPGVKQLTTFLDKLSGSGGASGAASTMQTAANTMLEASKNMKTAGSEEETAGTTEEKAAVGEEAGGAEMLGGAAGASILKTLVPMAGALGLGAIIGTVLASLPGAKNPIPSGGANSWTGSADTLLGIKKGQKVTEAQAKAIQELAEVLAAESYSATNGTPYKGPAAGNVAIALQKAGFNVQKNTLLMSLLGDAAQQTADGKQVGENISKGLAEGLKSEAPGSAARKQTLALIALVNELYGIKSPSKVFQEIGENNISGLVNGMTNTSTLDPAITKLTNGIITKVKSFEPQFVALGQDIDTWVASGIIANAGAINSAVNGALGGVTGTLGGARGGGAMSIAPVININITSPNGTLAPQILAQVEQVAQQAAEEVVATLQTGLFGL